jgi:tyrosyl-tRNA synthetase
MGLLDDLEARGLIHDSTERSALGKRLAAGPISVYVGFDPTAPSLHVGHLLGQITLRRFQLAGHRPIVLAGGATGMVGDPSGRSDERNLLDAATLRQNVETISSQLARILDFGEGPAQARLVNNYDWTAPISVLDFLRDVGKHFTVNQMVARESVRARMQSENGISFTEFSYLLLQSFDFVNLYETPGCENQIGGSDKMGNNVGGIDLIRRRHGAAAYGLTWPLVTRSDGVKMGKTAGGALWLDPELTSPYQFHQWWMQLPDADTEHFLKVFTLLTLEEIAAITAAHAEAPHRREAQRVLAREVTTVVHGQHHAESAESAAAVLFGGDPTQASEEVLRILAAEVPSTEVDGPIDDIAPLLVSAGLATSNGDARRTLAGGGISVNGRRIGTGDSLPLESFLHGQWALLRKGKSTYHIVQKRR